MLSNEEERKILGMCQISKLPLTFRFPKEDTVVATVYGQSARTIKREALKQLDVFDLLDLLEVPDEQRKYSRD